MNIDLENWMENLPTPLRNIPLIFLAIPGSHDSATYNLTSKSKIGPDIGSNLLKFKIFGPFFRFIVKKWSVTQSLSLTDQLKGGIRYLDFRIATYLNPKTNKVQFKLVHGLYGDDVLTVLNGIYDFLLKNSQEIILIDCQHFYNFSSKDHVNLVELFRSTFSDKLVSSKMSIFDLSLNYLETKNLQVILIYRHDDSCHLYDFLWASDYWPTPWPNTVNVTELMEKLNQGLQTRDLAKGYITQFLLTPKTSFIFRNLCSNLKQKCGVDILQEKFDWIRKKRSGIYGKLNIIISDFIELENYQFPKMVIELNYLSLEEDRSWEGVEEESEPEAEPEPDLNPDYENI